MRAALAGRAVIALGVVAAALSSWIFIAGFSGLSR